MLESGGWAILFVCEMFRLAELASPTTELVADVHWSVVYYFALKAWSGSDVCLVDAYVAYAPVACDMNPLYGCVKALISLTGGL